MKRLLVLVLMSAAALSPLACSDDSNNRVASPSGMQATQSMIGTAGGTLALTSGPASGSNVVIPANALTSDTMISIESSTVDASSQGEMATGPAVLFGPEGQTFASAVSITIPFDPTSLPAGVDANQLMVAKRELDTNALSLHAPLAVDGNANTLTVEVSSFSVFQAVYVIPNRAPLAVNDTISIAAGATKVVDVLANDSDLDGDNLTITSLTQPDNANVTIDGSQLRIVAGAELSYSHFSYTISDGEASDTAEVLLGVAPADAALNLVEIGSYRSNVFDEGVAEISAFDPSSKRLFVVNGNDKRIDVLDLADPSSPSLETSLNIQINGGAAANSVAVKNGVVAVAVEQETKQDNGQILFFSASSLNLISSVTVGALPDMVTFTPDGTMAVVANEGEPNDDYDVDPEGSISIIDLPSDLAELSQSNVRTASFTAFNADTDSLRAEGVRIFGPGASVAQDLEPEYVAVSADSTKAWVSLQENNAFAIVDLVSGVVSDVKALGYKDHSKTGFGLDASDRDAPGSESGSRTNITTWPVWGMYQPDSIASYAINGQNYIVSANEGDARDYDGYSEEERIEDLTLDPTAFPVVPGVGLDPQALNQLGRLRTSSATGDSDNDGDHDRLYSFGARSFSIWDEAGDLVWDSGDFIERYIHQHYPNAFNINDDEIESEARSDDKGPEPEALTVANFNNRWFAFVGLERQGGIFVFDISDPQEPRFVQYTTNRNLTPGFSVEENVDQAGDVAPEGLIWIDGSDSPIAGLPLVVVANEVSGSVTIYAALGDTDFAYPLEQDLEFTRESAFFAPDTVADESAAEIIGFDPSTNRVFTVNAFMDRIDVTSLDSNSTLSADATIDVDGALVGGSPNSLSIYGGVIAVAIENGVKGQTGVIAFYDTTSLALLSSVDAGVLPDMVTFTPDGTKVIVANEGEPFIDDQDTYVDPDGSITVIDMAAGAANLTNASARQLTFTSFEAERASLIEEGVRIYNYGEGVTTVAQALEPEYVAVNAASTEAYVVLQEANALAIVDLTNDSIESIAPLGYIDHSKAGFGLDASDRDGFDGDKRIAIQNWPVMGALMPDAIATFTIGSKEYLITANEGDAREIGDFEEDDNGIGDVTLDPTLFGGEWAAFLQHDGNLGRLGTWENTNDLDGDGDIDVLTSYGTRSTTIIDANTGERVWDSGDLFERLTAMHWPEAFNASNSNNNLDNRSDNKGPEPEAVTIGVINGHTYAFVALERQGNIVVLDVNNPTNPRFVTTFGFRDFAFDPEDEHVQAGDNGPECLVFISAEQSPSGKPLLLVGNEVSGSTTVWSIDIK